MAGSFAPDAQQHAYFDVFAQFHGIIRVADRLAVDLQDHIAGKKTGLS
jgi:hypothetical protein